MAQTGKVTAAFPYAVDGVTIETLAVGRILYFPDMIFPGLEKGGFIEPSDEEPENSVAEAVGRDVATSELRDRLNGVSDQDLKDIIARSGVPVSGNLVHAELVSAAASQLRRESEGRKPVTGVDPNAGVTEQPLAAPGAPTPPSAPATVEAAQANGSATPPVTEKPTDSAKGRKG